jgi:hypothetical protein
MDIARFNEKIEIDLSNGCWLWPDLRSKGYGWIWDDGMWMAHRWSYTQFVGEIPEGLTLDHLCLVKNCVNPSHLEVVTRGENVLRSMGPSAVNKRKTECVRGHALQGDNLYVTPSGRRQCRTCRARSNAKWLAVAENRDKNRESARRSNAVRRRAAARSPERIV